MRITRIDLAGENNNFAILTRKIDSKHIDVEILLACQNDNGEPEGYGQRFHHVQADDRDDMWSMAEILQHALDGHRGTSGDIDDYYQAVQRLGN